MLKDAQKAVDILTEKIAQHKKIRIIGDYDIDGICSITILYKALKKAGADVDYVVPHRITDGYGINEHLIDNAAAEGKDTILTCDNGIAAIPQIQYAKEHGLTVIVTDHHDIPFTEENGEKKLLTSCCRAIVDPKQRTVNIRLIKSAARLWHTRSCRFYMKNWDWTRRILKNIRNLRQSQRSAMSWI